MHVAPFAQPHMRQEVRAALVLQLFVRFLVRDGLFKPLPQLHPAEEFRFFVGELPVRLIGLLLQFLRALARVLNGQGARDDEHLAQTLVVAACQDHPRHPRVQRQPGHLPAQRGQRVFVVDRPEFLQELVAVGNCTA